MDADAAATLRENGHWSTVLEEDIHDLSSETILKRAGLKAGKLDVLVGGPPCQPFSRSAWTAKRLDDPRATTIEEFFRVVRDLKPRAFLMENVPGLGRREDDDGWKHIDEIVASVNESAGTKYSVSRKVLDAAHYGVPQHRKRLFIIGSRDGREFQFPRPTHGEGSTNGSRPLESQLTTWDAIGGLDDIDVAGLEVRGQWGALLPSIPEGKNYLFHTERGEGVSLFGWRTKFWSFLLKLAKDRPSPTLTANPGSATGPFHWTSRRLAVEELLLLQTFPRDYAIVGGRTAAQRQIGNAVPPALAQRLAIEVRAQLLGDRHARKRKVSFLPTRREDSPRREKTQPVPESYQELIGEYPDHPGPGKGPGALARKRESDAG